jgi:hypothetical protein
VRRRQKDQVGDGSQPYAGASSMRDSAASKSTTLTYKLFFFVSANHHNHVPGSSKSSEVYV